MLYQEYLKYFPSLNIHETNFHAHHNYKCGRRAKEVSLNASSLQKQTAHSSTGALIYIRIVRVRNRTILTLLWAKKIYTQFSPKKVETLWTFSQKENCQDNQKNNVIFLVKYCMCFGQNVFHLLFPRKSPCMNSKLL